MSKKDYQLIANAVKEYIDEVINEGEQDATVVARKLASKLATTNSRFDAKRFLEACGIK